MGPFLGLMNYLSHGKSLGFMENPLTFEGFHGKSLSFWRISWKIPELLEDFMENPLVFGGFHGKSLNF